MSTILNCETKIRYEENARTQISYETFIERIKNNVLTITIYANRQLDIHFYCENYRSSTIIISKNVKYSLVCDTMMEISKKIHMIESFRFDNYYISKEHINLINLLVSDHYIKTYDHQLVSDLPIHFQFKFECLVFHMDINKKDEFDIHQQIDYMFEMIKFYNPKTMALKFDPMFRNCNSESPDEIVKYISTYLSEQNIEFVNSGNLLVGYHIRWVK